MKVIRYLLLAIEGTKTRPHKSKWTSSSFVLALHWKSINDCLWCFPRILTSQGEVFLRMVGKPLKPYFFNKWRSSKLRCPNITCHKRLEGSVPFSWWERNAKLFDRTEVPVSFNNFSYSSLSIIILLL